MPLKWRKVWIADETFESAGVFDVNNDGIPDIVSGGYWYQGPDFRRKHGIGEVKPAGEYILEEGQERAFLSPLPVALVPGLDEGDLVRLREFRLDRVGHGRLGAGAWHDHRCGAH